MNKKRKYVRHFDTIGKLEDIPTTHKFKSMMNSGIKVLFLGNSEHLWNIDKSN